MRLCDKRVLAILQTNHPPLDTPLFVTTMVPRIISKVLASLPCRNTGKHGSTPRASEYIWPIYGLDSVPWQCDDRLLSPGADDNILRILDPIDVRNTELRDPVPSVGECLCPIVLWIG